MNITYENYGDYYIFSNNSKERVYLGDVSPVDYIHDITEQAKRSASCHYTNKETGKIAKKEDLDWFDFDLHDKYELICTYNFTNKVSIASMGSNDRSCAYNTKDPAMVRLAQAYSYKKSLEEYDDMEEKFRLKQEKWKRENPYLHNLVMFNNRTYYVNNEGKEITIEEHLKAMKEELGEDCFKIASSKIKTTVDGVLKLK